MKMSSISVWDVPLSDKDNYLQSKDSRIAKFLYDMLLKCTSKLYILPFTLVSVVTGGYCFPYTDRKL